MQHCDCWRIKKPTRCHLLLYFYFYFLERLCVFAYECFIFIGRVTNPSEKPPFLEDQCVFLSLASLLRSVRVGKPYQEQKVPADIARKVIEARKRSHKERTRDLWNTRRETQIQTKLDPPPWKNGQHRTRETRPHLQISRKKKPWTPQETMAMLRCRNRSNDLIHGGRWWWWWWWWLLRDSTFFGH